MEITAGQVCFISDSFFKKVDDPFLKIDYEQTKRPHYFAFKDTETSLYRLVPRGSRIEKPESDFPVAAWHTFHTNATGRGQN